MVQVHSKKLVTHMSTKNIVGRELLILQYASLVDQIAYKIKNRVPQHVDFEELRSVGYIGLIESIDRYDDSKNVPFKVYAEIRINGAMLDYLRKEDWLPRGLRQQLKKMQQAKQELHAQGKEITEYALAEMLQISLDDMHTLIMESQMKQVRSSDAVFSDSDAVLLEDMLTEDSVATIDMLIASESIEKVQEAINQLSDREREILEGYYFDGKNLRQIGLEMGVTESRVCQIRKTALESIRKILSIA